MIPAIVAYRQDGENTVAHAVGQHSDRAFCGQWTLVQTDRHWPSSQDDWTGEQPPCPVCAHLVYT